MTHASIELIRAMAGTWDPSTDWESFCGAPWAFGQFAWAAPEGREPEPTCARCLIAMDAAREGVVLPPRKSGD